MRVCVKESVHEDLLAIGLDKGLHHRGTVYSCLIEALGIGNFDAFNKVADQNSCCRQFPFNAGNNDVVAVLEKFSDSLGIDALIAKVQLPRHMLGQFLDEWH